MKETGPGRTLVKKSVARLKILPAISMPRRGEMGGEDKAPTDLWGLDRTVAWKRANGYLLPTDKILEPGCAGELDAEELDFIWQHIQRSLALAHAWGLRGRSLKRQNKPTAHLRRVALYGRGDA